METGLSIGELEFAMKMRLAARIAVAEVVAVGLAIAGRIVLSAVTIGTGSHPAAGPVESSGQIPVGTILPVSLENAIKVTEVRAGEVIEARIRQEVPLPNREKLRLRSKVTGTVVSVGKDSTGMEVNLSLRFTAVEYRDRSLPLAASLRAMASFETVRSAQMPFTGADSGTPEGWGTTAQIGGDIRFGDGGKVRNRSKQVVGKGVMGGVLVHVRAQPGTACEGPVGGDDRLQALWVFSSDACGTYGMKGVRITRTGKSNPAGEIILSFEKDNMKLESGTALLLRVVSQK